MVRWWLVLAVALRGGPLPAAAPPYPGWKPGQFEPGPPRLTFNEPFKVAIAGGRVLLHVQEESSVFTQAIPLTGPARFEPGYGLSPYPGPRRWPARGVTLTSQLKAYDLPPSWPEEWEFRRFPLRWQMTREACYLARTTGYNLDAQDYLRRFGLRELLDGTAKSDLTYADPPNPSRVFTRSAPGWNARIASVFTEFRDFVGYDYLPDGDAAARHFLLTNVRGLKTDEEKSNPKWSFTVHRCESKWDEKGKKWDPGPWSKEEELPVVFRENFQAFPKGDDYFFLTAAGKLWVARKPGKGKKRTLFPLVGTKERPVLGAVVDAPEQRTFFFLESDKGPAFFELSDRPKLVVYDPKAAAVPDGDEPLRSILHKARVLEALGRIKGK